VIDIQDDGEYLAVKFVRRNGEVVSGMYKLWGWGQPPATVMDEMGFVDRAGAAEMVAALRPRPGKKAPFLRPARTPAMPWSRMI
jgi:hypothetical protein